MCFLWYPQDGQRGCAQACRPSSQALHQLSMARGLYDTRQWDKSRRCHYDATLLDTTETVAVLWGSAIGDRP